MQKYSLPSCFLWSSFVSHGEYSIVVRLDERFLPTLFGLKISQFIPSSCLYSLHTYSSNSLDTFDHATDNQTIQCIHSMCHSRTMIELNGVKNMKEDNLNWNKTYIKQNTATHIHTHAQTLRLIIFIWISSLRWNCLRNNLCSYRFNMILFKLPICSFKKKPNHISVHVKANS